MPSVCLSCRVTWDWIPWGWGGGSCLIDNFNLVDISNSIDQEKGHQCALLERVVSGWLFVIVVSRNVSHDICCSKAAKLRMCMQSTTHTEAMCLPKDCGLDKQDWINNSDNSGEDIYTAAFHKISSCMLMEAPLYLVAVLQ